MGQNLGFYRLTGDKFITKHADDVPEHFEDRFQGRWDFFNAVLDVGEIIKTCGCGADRCRPMCSGDSVIRLTDFAALREKLGVLLKPDEDGDSIFRDMTDWLEAHPDVYVDYS